MSKYLTMEDLLRAKVKYLESECDNALDRLHQCKRRNREDKVKLRNTIVFKDKVIEQLRYSDTVAIPEKRRIELGSFIQGQPWNQIGRR
jgi:hypothetical protein